MSVSLRAASEFHRERLQSPQREALAVLRLVRDELELREPPHERVDGDLPFDAREWSAEAEVNAPAEGDVAGGGSGWGGRDNGGGNGGGGGPCPSSPPPSPTTPPPP